MERWRTKGDRIGERYLIFPCPSEEVDKEVQLIWDLLHLNWDRTIELKLDTPILGSQLITPKLVRK